MISFLEYLKESYVFELSRNAEIIADQKKIISIDKRVSIQRSDRGEDIIIPIGQNKLNSNTIKKLLKGKEGSTIGYNDVIKVLDSFGPAELKNLDKLFSMIYTAGNKSLTFKELASDLRDDVVENCIIPILDQMSGKSKKNEKQWTIQDIKTKEEVIIQ